MIKAVGFDLDNTLFDHTEAAGAAMHLLMQQQGWSYSNERSVTEEWHRVEGIYFNQYAIGKMSLMDHRRARMRDFMLSTDASASERGLEELWESYLNFYAQSWIAYPDALDALAELRESGLRMAVLTNGQQHQQESKLRAIGMGEIFEFCLAIGTVEALKPDPRAFAQLGNVLECQPNEMLFVGDDIEVDVRASINAGLRGIWLNRNGSPTPEGIVDQISTLSRVKNFL